MNFVSKFDAQLPTDGFGPHSEVHVEHPSAHAPADAIIVPDAHLLFGADFKRSGVDLILSNADRELVVHDYFKGEHRHPLASPDGAHLTGDIVNALTGHVEYAQAAGAPDAGAHVIGHVTKLTGSATAVRNGVSVILNNGDNVEKGDVVATGSDSSLGVTFIDGTVFGLSSNARMVLNEMVYDPNGSNNSSLISLVSGTISFVAGETAKHGDMKVDTPVATMGIRGTAVLVEINFDVPGQNGLPDAKFQVLVEPDGHTGSYILFDKTTLDPIATVNKAGQQVNINQNGVSFSQSPLSPELQKLISDVFQQKFSANDTNTKTFDHFTDSIVPPQFHTVKGPDFIIVTPVVLLVNNSNSLSDGPNVSPPSHPHIPGPPAVATTPGTSAELDGLTGSPNFDKASGIINFADINAGDQPTASTAFKSFTYQDIHSKDITANLTPTELAAVKAIEVGLDVKQDPAGVNHGTAIWTYSVADGALDFLGANETLTLTYLATVNNNFAPSPELTTVPITITIKGTNDVPVITSSVPQTIAFSGGTSVQGGDLIAHVPTSGTIAFDDPDLTDTHTVAVSNPTSTLTDPATGETTAFTLPPTPLAIFNSALTASITDPATGLPTDSTGTGFGSVSWSLAELPVWLGDFVPKNEILTLTYVVTVTDSQGAISQQDITVTITGTDTPAVVWIATTGTGAAPDGLWSTGANWETGNAPTSTDDAIIITDQLEGLTPTYPVTINSAAAANSLEMDNFGGSAPVLINQSTLAISTDFNINDHSTNNPAGYTGPELDNHGALTIGGAFNLNADSIVNNSSSLTVDGKMEVRDQSTVQNSGTIDLAGGGDFSGQSTISNTTTDALIEVSGGTLNVSVDIANSGTIKIDATAAAGLTLASATIDGGTVTNSGTLTLNGGAVVKNGTLGNAGQINVSGTGNALDNEQVTNTGGIEIAALGAVTLDLLTGVTNTGHTITVDSTVDGVGTLTLQGGASITSGNLSNSGVVNVEGSGATLDGVTVTGSGAINVDLPVQATTTTLVLEGTTSITDNTLTVGPTGILSVAGSATLDHVGVTNQNSVEVTAGHALTLDDGSSVDNASGTMTVDGTGKLTLNDASINGGTIDDFTLGTSGNIIAGDIDVTGSSTISNAHINNGNVTLSSNVTLTLDGTTMTGASFDDIASGATIQIDGGAANTVTLNGVSIDGGTINAFSSVPSGATIAGDIDVTGSSTISNVHLNNGNVTLGDATLTLDGSTVTGASFDDTAGGATIQIDGGAANAVILDGVSIDGGTINAFTSVPSGATIAADIDVTGDSTISNAALNQGHVAIDDGVHLTLDGSTVTGTSFDDTAGGVIQVDGGAGETLALSGATITGGAFAVATSGVVQTSVLVTLTDTAVTNDGTIEVTAGVLKITGGGSVADSVGHTGGTIQIDGGALLELGVSDTENVSFSGTGGELKIDTASFGGNIIGLDPGDQIDLSTIGYGPGATATYAGDSTGGELTVTDGQNSITLHLVGDYTNGHFAGSADSNNDLLITLNANDDAPVFTDNTASTATVAEVTAVTGSPALDDSTPAGGTFHFTDIDLTNRPIATVAQTVTWTGGNLSDTEASALEAGFHLSAPVTNTNSGEIDWTYSITDSSLDFLGAGQTATVTSTITLIDQFGGKDTATVTVTVDGANDIPTIAVTNGGLTEASNVTLGGATDTATGTITFTDADVTDHPTVTTSFVSADYTDAAGNDLTDSLTVDQQAAVTALETTLTLAAHSGNANNGSYDWTYSVADSALDFMAAGDKLVLTYNATVSDGHDGGTTSTPVTVTITGSDDAPTVGFAPAYLQFDGHSTAAGPVATANVGNGTGDAITLDGWVNWNGAGDTGHNQVLFYDGNTSFAGVGLFGTPTGNGTLDLLILAGGAEGIDTGITLTAGQWYNLALSHANGIFTLDINGAVAYTSGSEGAYAMGHGGVPDSMLIGGNTGGNEGFNGGVADVSVWNTALTQSQVQGIEFGTLSGTETGLAAYYPLNDGAGTTAADTANSAGNLSFAGNPAWQTSGSWPEASVSTAENHATTIDGLAVNDVDAGNSQIEVTLAAGHGSVSLSNATGLDSTHLNSDGSIELFGSRTAINTALAAGVVYTPGVNYSGADTLTVTANDQVSAALGGPLTGTEQIAVNVEPGAPVSVPTLTITVLAADGLNFKTDSPLSQMGSGTVQPGGDDSSFTILDSASGHMFVFDGSGFDTPTGGTISAIHELTSEGNTAIADFTGLSVSATAWIAAVKQAAAGDTSAVNSLVANYTVDFVGGSGPDQIGSAGHTEMYNGGGGDDVLNPGSASGGQHVLTGGAGSDTFVYQLGYGAVTITDFDQGNNPGVFAAGESDKIEVNGFSNQPNVQDDGHGNVTADFGNGDVLTFLNVTAAELNALNGSEIIGGGNNGGNGNGPVLGNADNSITYQGTPVLIDPSVTLSDPEATVSSVNVWISSGEQSGDQLTINGLTDGVIQNSDGSTISYHFDATINTGNNEGHGIVLTGAGGTLTTADFEAALRLIHFSSTSGDPTAGGTDHSRTITWAAYDNIQHSSTVTTTVNLDIAPVLNSMTLTIAQGGVDVLTNADFNVTDVGSSSFLYTVNNVTGGQFEVFNGTNWVSAPTGGFTTTQIGDGHVEFVQDGTAATPNFSIFVSDGAATSAAIAPTVHFTPDHSSNFIVNGGFETGDFTGWTLGGDNASSAAVVGPASGLNDASNHGVHLALLGAVGDDVTLSQSVATTAGEHYTVDFWLVNDWSAIPAEGRDNDFGATWNGTALMPTIVNAGQGTGYTEYQFDVTATGNQSTLEFSARNDGGYWNLDDVSVREGEPNAAHQMNDQTTSVSGVNSGDALTITAANTNSDAGPTVTATAGAGTIEWQFQASNAQLDHLMGMTQSYTVAEQNNAAISQTVAVSVAGAGNDQFVFTAGVGADTMLNFTTVTNAQGHYAGDTIDISAFAGITSTQDVLAHLSADSHGNAVVDLGNHDSITFQGLSVAVIQANASHIFQV